jgi:hypothetical protein
MVQMHKYHAQELVETDELLELALSIIVGA